ncbi:hypothetical protein KIN20_032374 [Parelaphostrongylus tenuis]|uniref:Uncharacterized protein n=1 Tax=Parelaphostrongylus tenuis TaxID=148309 RepID=A0AAD5R6X5_PARTN|nr:hypothetical protein KIN20_032374 [Parelaphostrongylus tenuis]
MVLKSIGFVGRGLFNCAPTALAASGGVHQQQRSNYSYVGMASESDGTFAGDFNYGLHTLLFTELFRGFGVMLGHVFMEPTTISYPFEKGPLSSRFR